MLIISEKRFKPLETIIVIILIAILVFVIKSYYMKLELISKINTVSYDLKNLNLQIKLYKIRKGKAPDDLKKLVDEGYFALENNSYIKNTKSKFMGDNFYDIFGNAYVYDNSTGVVSLNKKTLEIINKGLK
jgi:competence protein ComGC